ncbi:MAG: hypothetical protein ACK50N_00580 [Flavobacteriales bacterium]|jgi:hypothetical protein
MSKFIRRVAISPDLAKTFNDLDRTVETLDSDVARGENYGDAYQRRDIPSQLYNASQNRERLLNEFESDFPDHVRLLKYTHLFDVILKSGTRRIWMCYQMSSLYPDPNLDFVEKIHQIVSG